MNRNTVSDFMKPGPKRIEHLNGSFFLHKDEERRLESILRLVRITEHTCAHP